MDDRELLRDVDFDALLEQELSQLPPEDIVEGVTPWRHAMRCILWGIALTTLTLNVWCLDAILPAIGMLLMLLGFRTLRRENGAFRVGFALTVARAAILYPTLLWQATIWPLPGGDGTMTLLTGLNLLLQALHLICLGCGLAAVRQKADLPSGFGATVGFLVWYAALIFLGIVGYTGILVIVLIVVYLLLIRSLFGLSRELDEAGYAIRPASVRISDGALSVGLTTALLLLLALAYTFGRTLPMEWTPLPTAESTEVEAVRADLRALGFPDLVLRDLADEDILACRGAVRVVVNETRDHPLNEGRNVTEKRGDGYYSTRVYDAEELRHRGVTVELGDGTWRIFHHFALLDETRMYGTESIQSWPAYRESDRSWRAASDFSGRLLCERDGAILTAPYHSLGGETYTQTSILWGSSRSTDVFAEFSLPNDATARRGYLTYAVAEKMPGVDSYISSWITYTHQRTWLQYPAKTAKEQRMTTGRLYDGAFISAQDAIQFYTGDPE